MSKLKLEIKSHIVGSEDDVLYLAKHIVGKQLIRGLRMIEDE